MARLALPAAAGAVLHHAFRPVDQFFVQGLGKEAQGALGACTFVVILTYAAFLLVSAGAGPLVARATGAGDAERRRAVLGEAMFACGALAVLVAATGFVAAPSIAGLLGLEGATAAHASAYLRALFTTGAALCFTPLVDASWNAMGRTRLPMGLQGLALALNVALTPVLVARMGVAGAAYASTLAQTVAVLLGARLLWREVGLRPGDVRPGPLLATILRIGSPVAVSTGLYALVYQAMLRTSISPLGPAVNAGLGIGFSALEAVTWPLYLGGSIAVSSLVGRSLGAGRPDRAWEAVRLTSVPVVALGTAVGLVFWFAGPALVGRFTDDPAAFEQAVLYAAVLAWSQPFVALEAFSEGVLAGAGDTRKVFWSTVPFNLVRVPLAWALAFPLGMGAAGVWWAINVTSYGKALAKAGLVMHGGWARARL